MKHIILILTILTISFSCKKQSVEPAPEPEPIKTSKSFVADIYYTVDSLNTGYYVTNNSQKGTVEISIDTVPYDGTPLISKGLQFSGQIGSFTIERYDFTLTSNNLNKPFTYYISVREVLIRSNVIGVATYIYTKQYTFNEGDNGIINFNTLP